MKNDTIVLCVFVWLHHPHMSFCMQTKDIPSIICDFRYYRSVCVCVAAPGMSFCLHSACTHACVLFHMHTHLHTNLYAHTCICVVPYACMHVFLSTFRTPTHACVLSHMHVYLSAHSCMCVVVVPFGVIKSQAEGGGQLTPAHICTC